MSAERVIFQVHREVNGKGTMSLKPFVDYEGIADVDEYGDIRRVSYVINQHETIDVEATAILQWSVLPKAL